MDETDKNRVSVAAEDGRMDTGVNVSPSPLLIHLFDCIIFVFISVTEEYVLLLFLRCNRHVIICEEGRMKELV